MVIIYKIMPTFAEIWIKCLKDLSWYRIAIKNNSIRNRTIQAAVSRNWYNKASDKAPTTKRLYYHLTIIARPNTLQQLFYYSKALYITIPFPSANNSIITLFNPIITPNSIQNTQLPPIKHTFVVTHNILFSKKITERLEPTKQGFFSTLNLYINHLTHQFLKPSYYIKIFNYYVFIGYNKYYNPIHKAFQQAKSTNNKARTTAPKVDLPIVGSEINKLAT